MPKSNPPQLGLFDPVDRGLSVFEDANWPAATDFPLNLPGRKVGDIVDLDLLASREPLIVAGYASLDQIIELLTRLAKDCEQVRLLFGSEPYPSRREEFVLRAADFAAEVEHYWLSRGISLRLSGKIVRARELLKSGRVVARHLGSSRARLHAKIYCGDDAVTLGSSNYTASGMRQQIEANVRFTSNTQKRRFADTKQIAENFWAQGVDYSEALDALLEKLLKLVSWQEALARGCAELLEGDWARERLQSQVFSDDLPLWPSQVQGIAQALWLLATVGSVLIADATGSGKTRMGAHLLRSVVERIWGSGRKRKGRPVMVCPPAVEASWEHEATLCELSLDARSHGLLSHAKRGDNPEIHEALRRAQVLAVDEAHNFLNPSSERTRMLHGNMADHTVLFTATPINKSAIDLLHIADMLGADNFDDSTLGIFDSLLRRRSPRGLTEAQLDLLRRELQRFTVRRTKTRLNAMIDEAPDNYRDRTGRRCRYPAHDSATYALSESVVDRRIAREIRAEAERLVGVALVRKPVEMPEVLIREGWSEQEYLDARLLGARKLAAYLIMSSLRSSRAALLEHLIGTQAALAECKLQVGAKKQDTGDQLRKLTDMAGHPPSSRLTIEVPNWLVDPDAHRAAANDEHARYSRIRDLARSLSIERESTKAQQLLNMLEDHDQIVAFDRCPITLVFLERLLVDKLGRDKVILATGGSASGRKLARKLLAPGSPARGIVALCSDAMSEGVNLQQASAIVHLDMPSVLRIAEQRVGRVDRMDSPHASIQAWWPEDAEEFALRTDDRFIERYETVDSLLGSNLPLPAGMTSSAGRPLTATHLIAEYDEATAEAWDGIQDAFAPVRGLVEGSDALVDRGVYAHYRHSQARVVARVSVVTATAMWAYFCVAGTRIGAPHWVFLDAHSGEPVIQLGEIVPLLRSRLGADTKDLPFDARAAERLEEMLRKLSLAERLLLPKKKQRALEELKFVLENYSDLAGARRELKLRDRLDRVLDVFGADYRGKGVDWDSLAEKWLDLIRPVWYARLTSARRKRPLRLKDIRKDLIGEKHLNFEAVLKELEEVAALPPLHERVVSCVLGIAQ